MLFGELKKKMKEKGAKLSVREGTAEFEYFIAAGTLESGEGLPHGLSHLAELLSFDPNRREWLDLYDGYLGKVDDPSELFEDSGKSYFAIEALRARTFAAAGKIDKALDLLIAVYRARSDIPYLDWCLDWLEPAGAIEALPAHGAYGLLGAIVSGVPDIDQATAPRRRIASRFADLALRVHAAFELEPSYVLLVAGALRRAGRFKEGVAIARASYEASPSWGAAVGEGLILRVQGDTAAAEAAFRRALEHDTSDVTALLEAGDMYFDRDEWAAAKALYGEVLAVATDHAWALPSSLYCAWKLGEDDDAPARLAELASADPPNRRAGWLRGRHRKYDGFLPRSSDATSNVVGQIVESIRTADPTLNAEPGSYSIAVTCLEAPSNVVAFELACAAAGRPSELDITYSDTDVVPDPRTPLRTGLIEMWTSGGARLSPALPKPPPNVSQAIAALSRERYSIDRLWASASVVAEKLGAGALEEVLASAVHPPPPPDVSDVVAWVGRVQLSVALVLAHFGSDWDDSPRQRGLHSMLFGPRDWATGAAIIAMTKLAQEERALSLSIGGAFTELDEARPSRGHWDYLDALYWNWQDLPHLSDKERHDIHAKLVALHEQP